MGKRSLPPGFRFHPTDVELVRYYLRKKVLGKKLHEAIAEVDIYKYAPWDLPDKSLLRTGDLKWYFFCPRERKYASGGRMNRATSDGYWKTTGNDRCVHYKDEVAGMIKTLVFHNGKAPKGHRTDWVMYEYRLEEKGLADVQEAYVLCVIFKKDGPGPRNGAQYGAPFNEEEWDDDGAEEKEEEVTQTNSIITSLDMPVSMFKGSSMPCPSWKLPSAYQPLNVGSNPDASGEAPQVGRQASAEAPHVGMSASDLKKQTNQNSCVDTSSYVSCPSADKNLSSFSNSLPWGEDLEVVPEDDELLSLLAPFDENDKIEDAHNQNVENIEAESCLNGSDIFNGLGEFPGEGFSCRYNPNDFMEQILQGDNGQYLELMDLDTPLGCPTEAGLYEQVQSSGLLLDSNCYCPSYPCSETQIFPGPCWSTMLLDESYGYLDPVKLFRKEDGIHGNPNQVYSVHKGSLHEGNSAVHDRQDMGSTNADFDAIGRSHLPGHAMVVESDI